MISETVYMDQLRNCSKFNRRLIQQRRRPFPFFDQQTGIAQRPTNHLVRLASERYKSDNPLEICRYTAKRWRKNPKISFDSVEFKHIISSDLALKSAVDALMNPDLPSAITSNEASNDSIVLRTTSGKTNFENMELEDYDHDDFDLDQSDEEDWGDRKKKRKRGQGKDKDASFKGPSNRRSTVGPAGGANSATSTPNNAAASVESRPFACVECGARYKSRPGLTYHRLHVHPEQQSDSPKMASPRIDAADSCDFCQGNSAENKKTKRAEELVSCHDCGRSAHPSCLNFTPNMIVSTKKHGWQCIECKSCVFCSNSDHDDKLLFCDDCDRGFHFFCLKPPLKSAPENEWSCGLCQEEFGDRASNPKR